MYLCDSWFCVSMWLVILYIAVPLDSAGEWCETQWLSLCTPENSAIQKLSIIIILCYRFDCVSLYLEILRIAVPRDSVYRLYLAILCISIPRNSVYRLYLVILCPAVPPDSVYRHIPHNSVLWCDSPLSWKVRYIKYYYYQNYYIITSSSLSPFCPTL